MHVIGRREEKRGRKKSGKEGRKTKKKEDNRGGAGEYHLALRLSDGRADAWNMQANVSFLARKKNKNLPNFRHFLSIRVLLGRRTKKRNVSLEHFQI